MLGFRGQVSSIVEVFSNVSATIAVAIFRASFYRRKAHLAVGIEWDVSDFIGRARSEVLPKAKPSEPLGRTTFGSTFLLCCSR